MNTPPWQPFKENRNNWARNYMWRSYYFVQSQHKPLLENCFLKNLMVTCGNALKMIQICSTSGSIFGITFSKIFLIDSASTFQNPFTWIKLRNLNSIYLNSIFFRKTSVIWIFDQNIKILGRLQSYTEYPVITMKKDLFLKCNLPYKTVTYNFNL